MRVWTKGSLHWFRGQQEWAGVQQASRAVPVQMVKQHLGVSKRPQKCGSAHGAVPAFAEFTKIAMATGLGFLVMGFIGFFVKLMCVQPCNPSTPLTHVDPAPFYSDGRCRQAGRGGAGQGGARP
mgnify:FL=1